MGIASLGAVATLSAENAYADPEPGTSDNAGDNAGDVDVTNDKCQSSLGTTAWLVCPTTSTVAGAVDWLYEKIESLLVINPVEAKDGTPIYEIWKYCRGITNIVFIIFLLVVIYSQITGVGISNYGLKKALPKLIVAAVLVNLSFLICQLGVDLSNIIGNSLRGMFAGVQESVLSTMEMSPESVADLRLSYAHMYNTITAGGVAAIGAAVISFETGSIWMLIPVILGAVVAVASGLITIALRQAVVALLVMISPLAIVAYMLPNTEKLFQKWKKLLIQMLVFYPMFSLLFGASSLAGFAIMASAKDGFWLLLGMAVQIFPLFFSWSLMRMSGTVLGTINAKIRSIAARPLAGSRAWADSRRQAAKAKHLASDKVYTPSLALRQYLENRKIAREAELEENKTTIKNRGLAYKASRNYDKNGAATKEGANEYEQQARNMRYAEIIERDKNNMNKGLGQLEAQPASAALRARLESLDTANVMASDRLKIEKARGELIEYENAVGYHRRMEDAMNAHFDAKHGYTADEGGRRIPRGDYKPHFTDETAAAEARARYTAANRIMENNAASIQYAAATAATAYDTQKKIVETKMGKYFELTPPTKDVEYRLGELTKNADAIANIDSIVAGLRVLNQRGDTDLLKQQLDNVLSHGLELGTHASQSLASFLMFEVKDNDPFLRRFGKYINLETARAYNSNDRKVMNVTYDEYVKGYHDGEVELINEANPTGRMYAKKGMKTLVEGTSLDNIERTALSNLDDSLKKAYGFDENNPGAAWDVSGWLKKREEIQTAFEPAFISASLKWLSGSEQINSGVKFWTGYEQKQKKEEIEIDGRRVKQVVTDENGNPVYEWVPVWNERAFAGHEKEVRDYFQGKTMSYIKDQTPSQILGMRSDYRDAVMEHLVEQYFGENPDEREKYDEEMAAIQTRYGDEDIEKAKQKRKADVKKLKMETAGKQMRKILGKTGKLEQIYRTRRSGAANNAKDWLREWVSLDNENMLYREVDYYRRKQQEEWEEEMRRRKEADPDFEYDIPGDVYNESDQARFKAEMGKINDEYGDGDTETFFEKTREKLNEWFPDDYLVWKYDKYHENNPYATVDDLYDWIRDTLDDLSGYPGNRDRR